MTNATTNPRQTCPERAWCNDEDPITEGYEHFSHHTGSHGAVTLDLDGQQAWWVYWVTEDREPAEQLTGGARVGVPRLMLEAVVDGRSVSGVVQFDVVDAWLFLDMLTRGGPHTVPVLRSDLNAVVGPLAAGASS